MNTKLNEWMVKSRNTKGLNGIFQGISWLKNNSTLNNYNSEFSEAKVKILQ